MTQPRQSSGHSRRYSPRVLAHLQSAPHAGTLDAPDAEGRAGSQSCGDLVHIRLRVEAGVIVDARFQAFGCPATIAAAAEIVSRLPGCDLVEAARLGHESIADELALPDQKRACSEVAADALHNALEDWVRGRASLSGPAAPLSRPGLSRPKTVLVAMSGGVDSSVAALLLRREGLQPVGVTFRLWSDPSCSVGAGCCSPETVLRARRVAHALGMPHVTVDLTDDFHRTVVDDFVKEYAAARTPNPCVACNYMLRFSALVELSDRLGIDRVATGHYALLLGTPRRLHRAADPAKDQAYVLARVAPELLERVEFPLGAFSKPEVRQLAKAAGLEVHDAEESQEICFIPDDDYRRFLSERLGVARGPIIDREGRHLGTHEGAYRFTIGQRKGLGLAMGDPVYVSDIRAGGVVVVGPREDLLVDEVVLRDVVWQSAVEDEEDLTAQLRSSGLTVPAHLEHTASGLILRLKSAVVGVARGQTGVVFEGDRVVLAGVIHRTARAGAPQTSGTG